MPTEAATRERGSRCRDLDEDTAHDRDENEAAWGDTVWKKSVEGGEMRGRGQGDGLRKGSTPGSIYLNIPVVSFGFVNRWTRWCPPLSKRYS